VGAQRTAYTGFLCASPTPTHPGGGAPSPPADHSRTDASSEPDASSAPLGLHRTEFTSSVWPTSVRSGAALPTPHKCISLSVEHVANIASDAHARSKTGAL
jgi:hypothetical protein